LESTDAPGESRAGGFRAFVDFISDQGQFSQHFRRLTGAKPGQFRTPSTIA
jgi:hypothetical protein